MKSQLDPVQNRAIREFDICIGRRLAKIIIGSSNTKNAFAIRVSKLLKRVIKTYPIQGPKLVSSIDEVCHEVSCYLYVLLHMTAELITNKSLMMILLNLKRFL
ncbi:hypothetical protein GQX74_002663 [Glossina fuscipes]|nr:hypothetical protein GQX74_002663 [Glossina fuscipes]